MNRLIIMRHGKAEGSSPGGDFERGLTARGTRDATLMGQVLAQAGLAPDLALVSSARRTRETWAAAAAAFPPARCLLLRPLYHAASEAVLAEVEAQGEDAGTVMVVGHNPGLHELTVGLLRQAGAGEAVVQRANARFPTATVAAFLFDEAGRPCYDGLFYAAEHGGGGGRVTRIYKLLPGAEWATAQASGVFEGSAIDHADGYIHFSAAHQAQETASRYFAGQAGLMILTVEAEPLGEALKWEASRGGDLFPHLYASLPVASVIEARPVVLDDHGVPKLSDLEA